MVRISMVVDHYEIGFDERLTFGTTGKTRPTGWEFQTVPRDDGRFFIANHSWGRDLLALYLDTGRLGRLRYLPLLSAPTHLPTRGV